MQIIEGNQNILINVDELQTIMTKITSIYVCFATSIEPNLQQLSQLKYYEGGEGGKTLEQYTQILNKMMEISDLYHQSCDAIYEMMSSWLEQDKQLADALFKSIDSSSLLVTNLQKLYNDYQGE